MLHFKVWTFFFWTIFHLHIVKTSLYTAKNMIYSPLDNSINKVSFTQRGYIQFLKYIVDVPTLSEYTFCIWFRSNNLTFAQPILSYSKNEEERLIRFWLSPQGTHINLAINEEPLFHIPLQILENHWYHFCQSWSSYQGAWNFYINGKLKSSGLSLKKNNRIKGDGDIIIGQEYTDFDKGLDDGIEGDVFGFNFVLSSTFPTKFQRRDSNEENTSKSYQYILPYYPAQDVPQVLSYFNMEPNRKGKGFFNVLNKMFNLFDDKVESDSYFTLTSSNRRILNGIEQVSIKTIGQRLVDLSFNCQVGRGAPLIGDLVLISWTKTPVRVFGGAILKNVSPFCVS